MTPDHALAGRQFFEDETFTGLDLSGADLSEKEFVRCTFTKSQFVETGWSGARLDECIFEGCDLTRMRPSRMLARGVEFQNCRLLGIIWSEMGLNPTINFEGCNLQYASFVSLNLRNARFLRCRMIESQFIETCLAGADFTGSDLSASRFEDCDVRKANFGETQGLFLDPARNKVADALIGIGSAVLLAGSFGLRVSGFDDQPGTAPTRPRGRADRRE